jgi:hypothetical protein
MCPLLRLLQLVMVASILYCPFLAFAKFSLLLFYLKLSPLRCFRLCIYASMFLVFGYSIALLGPLIFPCTPFKKTWDMTVTEGSCIDRTPVYMATAVLNMITDFLLLVLPLPMVVNLHAPRAQKVGLICAFGIGSVLVYVWLHWRSGRANEKSEPALQVVYASPFYFPCYIPLIRHGRLSCQGYGCMCCSNARHSSMKN